MGIEHLFLEEGYIQTWSNWPIYHSFDFFSLFGLFSIKPLFVSSRAAETYLGALLEMTCSFFQPIGRAPFAIDLSVIYSYFDKIPSFQFAVSGHHLAFSFFEFPAQFDSFLFCKNQCHVGGCLSCFRYA